MDVDNFTINFENLISNKTVSSIVRLLAVEIMNKPYLSVGEWLNDMSNEDNQSLMDLIEKNDDYSIENQILLSLLLSRSEGVFFQTDEELNRGIASLQAFVAISNLHKKGLVIAVYKNMSFGEDAMQLEIAKKIED
jgi:hypothetical protein